MNRPHDLHPAAQEQIRVAVNTFVGRWCEGEDLAQDLALHVVAQQQRFDPSRGAPSTFYAAIVRNKSISLERATYAAKRRGIRDTSGTDPADLPADPVDFDISVDVHRALDGMTVDCKAVATLLMAGCNVVEVSRRTGMSRGRVRGLCTTIAETFRQLGLEPEWALSRPCRRRSA